MTTMTDAESGLARGIALMCFLKLVVVGIVGLSFDAWYVWIWSWLAFAWMLPWFLELFREIEQDAQTDEKKKSKAKSKGSFGREMKWFWIAIAGAFAIVFDAIFNADNHQDY